MSGSLAGTYITLAWHVDSNGARVPPGERIELDHESAKRGLEQGTCMPDAAGEVVGSTHDGFGKPHDGERGERVKFHVRPAPVQVAVADGTLTELNTDDTDTNPEETHEPQP